MELRPYVDRVRIELGVAAAAGGDEAEALAERLTAPLESALRLTLLEALSAAAEEITRELAPGSVEVRLRGLEPEFAVATGALDPAEEAPSGAPRVDLEEDGGTWRVTLRLPEGLRSGVDAAARREGQSVNAWLVRAVLAALGHGRHSPPRPSNDKNFSGWVR